MVSAALTLFGHGGSMIGPRLLIALLALALPLAPAAGGEECRLCFEDEKQAVEPGQVPLKLEITSGLQFSRLALSRDGWGSVRIDPTTGSKETEGNVQDLGGQVFEGRARVIGEPLRAVRIDLPPKVWLRAPDGTKAELIDMRTDLGSFPTLDATGSLEFKFGGTLLVNGMGSGRLRGRIPIEVSYVN